jgi:hypothetical protein
MTNWKRLGEIAYIRSPWVTLTLERWLSDKGKELEYWRVEKADSVIVLPIQAGHIICAAPTFRPGIGRATLDLPGGRLPEGNRPSDIVPALLERELGVAPDAITRVEPLNAEKWIVNSSFSNQGLWAFSAEIDERYESPGVGAKASADRAGVDRLMAQLDCLQCRAVLMEWLHRQT